MQTLAIEYHVYIWQVSPQLRVIQGAFLRTNMDSLYVMHNIFVKRLYHHHVGLRN